MTDTEVVQALAKHSRYRSTASMLPTNRIQSLDLLEVRDTPRTRSPHGQVVHDDRGNAVWDWAVATGVLARKTVAELMTTLEVATLAIEGECMSGEWGGDPYNRPGR